MAVYFSSDNHYFHANIIKYCSRPFRDVDEMNAAMVDNWNSVVKDEDVVFHLGDVSAGLRDRVDDFKALIGSLRGKKVLIRGNHDHQTDEWYVEAGFRSVHESLVLGGVLMVHYPVHEAISRKVDDSGWGVVEHVVHGHIHRCDVEDFEDHYNVAVDRHGFVPVSSGLAIPSRIHDKFLEETINFFS